MQSAQYKKIPNRLRKCRLARNLTRETVAQILGLKFTGQISQWEIGGSMPTLVNAFKLASVYKVFVEDLYYDSFDRIRTEVTSQAQKVLEGIPQAGAKESTAIGSTLTR